MQWWADVWDAVARFFGYEHWEWGSAGEWVAAIGTVLAVWTTIHIIRRDKKVADEAPADSFVTTVDLVAQVSTKENKTWVDVTGQNLGHGPISDCQIYWHIKRTDGAVDTHHHNLAAERDVESRIDESFSEFFQIQPSERVHRRIYVEPGARLVDAYVAFSDYRGRRWIRNMLTHEYSKLDVIRNAGFNVWDPAQGRN